MTIVVTNLIVEKFGKKILDNISLELKGSRTIGLVGPSGSGKTTLIRALVGSQRINSGSAKILGIESGSRELRSRIGYMAQKSSLYGDLTVRENLEYFATVFGVSKSRVDELLELMHLNEHSKKLANSLSGGETTRLSLGIALLADPDIYFLDEPTVGLDPILRAELWNVFRELRRNGKTLVITSHIMDEAERCDDIVLMRSSKVIFHGSLESLKAKTNSSDVEDAFIKLATGEM
ncbi:MAG: ABC transporter ATP-binding protein [Actinomycetota bacterium]